MSGFVKQAEVDAVDIHPLGDYIAIVPEDLSKVTSGGIHIPETVNDKLRVGKVVGVGPGRYDNNGRLVPIQAKVGMRVLYDPAYHMVLTLGDNKFVLIRDPECRAALGAKASEYLAGDETYKSNPAHCPVERLSLPQ